MTILTAIATFGIWAGSLAAPAGAAEVEQPGPNADVVAASVGTAVQASIIGPGCFNHSWYYRIYVVGSGRTLFRWNFQFSACISPSTPKYWYAATDPSDSVGFHDATIQASTVRGKITASNGIFGPLLVSYVGAVFKYCPSTCTQTFTPFLAWIYKLDGTRAYIGDVPLV